MSEKEDKAKTTTTSKGETKPQETYYCPTIGNGKVVKASSTKEASNKAKEK